MPKEQNPEEVKELELTPEEKCEKLETENKRLTVENEKLTSQNKKIIKAFNKLMDEYNELHLKQLLSGSDD